MIDCVHGLPGSLETTHEELKQFHSIRLAIGTWEFRSGRWERCLNLNGFFNLELRALGSGCAAFYPMKPSLRECVRRLEANKIEGLPFDEVFPELCFEYTIFIFDNGRIKIFLFDGQDRVYPAPIGAAKARLEQEAEGIRKDLPSSEDILPNSEFVFRSHLNPCVAIPDMLLKLRYRHGDADSPKWKNAPQQELDLFQTLSPADYMLDRTKWDVLTEPPSSQRYKMDGIRFSARNRPVHTDGPQVLKSKIPTRDVKTAASPSVKAPACAPSTNPSAKPSRIPRLSLASGNFAPPLAQPRMRTRSQSKRDAMNNGEHKLVTSSRDY
ncbi:uncharacterized protein SCHCODRAFT_02665940 [Schizophyllum commune H4-8]|uniref:Uncharacterized protein n=1 Tax=Schizophyllum commune (strain H4-8 / FGSC 9210) TaxID=578458 RepID=D8Q1Y3_SCHCM|nr:uncharacterized protein SCHCODRAFT_02665940 [Schizophyllum commune H4-8]KAI5895621.1 hypothetical protein SCHCODRAFT_02665940 [Schizophyllum commune H4-8]